MEADPRDTENDLAFDIAYGLKDAGLNVPKAPGKLDTFDLLVVAARKIVAHIKLARWRFKRLPPDLPHGSAYRPPSDQSDQGR
jgi:hypothetical protein